MEGIMNRFAFTLAEVLITIAVIGIVAILTVPAIVKKYQKKVVAIRAKQAYSTLAEAIKLSEIENGPSSEWNIVLSSDGTENTKLVVDKYIAPYLNNLRFCDNNSDDISKKCGAFLSSAGKGYFLPNGTSISFVAGGESYNEDEAVNDFIFAIIVDTNAGKKPNMLGYDAFYFQLNKDGFGPLGFNQRNTFTRSDILNGFVNDRGELISCKKESIDENDLCYRHGCTLLLMLDNWEIKDDYPW